MMLKGEKILTRLRGGEWGEDKNYQKSFPFRTLGVSRILLLTLGLHFFVFVISLAY